MTPTLSTERLTLTRLTVATKYHVEWLNDPVVVQYSEQRHVKHDLVSCQDYINSFRGQKDHIWSVTTIKTGLHIGNITAVHDVPNNVSDVGILLGERDCWHQGYGTEAWKAVCEFLLGEKDGCRKIEAGCMADNTAMLRIFNHTGMKCEGERKNHFLLNGRPVNLMQYARFR